jgi:hypothetical protein
MALPIVQNGDFETPHIPINSGDITIYKTYDSGNPPPAEFGWTLLGDSIEQIGDYWYGASGAAGDQSLDLNGNHAGGVSQQITFDSAGLYSVNFFMSGNPDVGGTKTMKVSLGTDSQDFSYDSLNGHTPHITWVSESAIFNITTPGTYTLSFLSTTVSSDPLLDGSGPALDRVSISQVSAPEHLGSLTFATTVAGLAVIRSGLLKRLPGRRRFAHSVVV